MSFIAYFNMLF